ncbi:YciI family protein [Devosia sp.]|uniref:YciI family protein n=1 Tax=Devosia sp. TaxID=1871048 RepID=UPI003A9056DC
MRFMVLVKASPESEAGQMPSQDELMAMGKYNEELVKAGVMLDGGGLHPSSKAARIHIDDGKASVTDGPFAETHELVAGYWLWECGSLAEAIEWGRRCPGDGAKGGFNMEIRQLFDLADFEDGPGIEQHHKVAAEMAERETSQS